MRMQVPIYREIEAEAFLQRLQDLRRLEDAEVERVARDIIDEVRRRGDEALLELTRIYDGASLSRGSLRASPSEFDEAWDGTDPEVRAALAEAAKNIHRFHQRPLPDSWLTWEEGGVILGERFSPIRRVGVYVPGGRAAYPSTLLMCAIPAKVAGVEEIAVCTAPTREGKANPLVLVAARIAGVDEVYKVGGAQAIAALAFGTESIPPVDKIVGPGNAYVTAAKRLVFGYVGIDMLAGPSEVVILADDSAQPSYVAADLLAQSEHDPLSMALLVTPSERLSQAVASELEDQLRTLPRREIAEESLKKHGGILLGRDLEQCLAWIDRIAPEHLGIHVREPWAVLPRLRHAGSIFLGIHSPEAVGDYWAGPNHVLPTGASARFSSALSVRDFVKASNLISYSKEALLTHGSKIARLARAEGLEGHARAIETRVKTHAD
jgi:histidinol dehydrogenase